MQAALYVNLPAEPAKEVCGSPQDIASLWTQINLEQEEEELQDGEWELFGDDSSDDDEYDHDEWCVAICA
jgi:hypothetical protein